ncbi:MAG: class I SAM-dependent methyltransferase [Patescibacteria group bacterium]|nr:class I SAM-dependent methyltransferase [Patescibacteria group bacterium]
MNEEKTYKKEKLQNTNPDLLPIEKFRFNKIIPLVKGPKVLDAGCGNGHLLQMLSNKKNLKLTGFDLSPGRIKISKKNTPKANIYQDSIYKISQKDKSFDTVFCLEVIEHIKEYQKAVKEILRITKKRAIISVPYNEKIIYEICIHCGRETPRNRHQNSFDENKFIKIIDQKSYKVKFIKFNNYFNTVRSKNSFLLALQIQFDRFLNFLMPNKARHIIVIIDRK